MVEAERQAHVGVSFDLDEVVEYERLNLFY
jgi:hypothetical protein